MIVRKGQARSKARDEPGFGAMETASFSDSAGITQYGAYLQTLQPGARSSTRHWHEQEDEFLYVVAGRVTVVENDGPHILEPGDAACWPAGVPNAHHVLNESSEPLLVPDRRHAGHARHLPPPRRRQDAVQRRRGLAPRRRVGPGAQIRPDRTGVVTSGRRLTAAASERRIACIPKVNL